MKLGMNVSMLETVLSFSFIVTYHHYFQYGSYVSWATVITAVWCQTLQFFCTVVLLEFQEICNVDKIICSWNKKQLITWKHLITEMDPSCFSLINEILPCLWITDCSSPSQENSALFTEPESSLFWDLRWPWQ